MKTARESIAYNDALLYVDDAVKTGRTVWVAKIGHRLKTKKN